jgi:hypothetical protein
VDWLYEAKRLSNWKKNHHYDGFVVEMFQGDRNVLVLHIIYSISGNEGMLIGMVPTPLHETNTYC